MSHLRFNHDNSLLTCGCGAVSVKTHDWNAMAEWRRDQIDTQARKCHICKSATIITWTVLHRNEFNIFAVPQVTHLLAGSYDDAETLFEEMNSNDILAIYNSKLSLDDACDRYDEENQ